jgi:hypothetical protein
MLVNLHRRNEREAHGGKSGNESEDTMSTRWEYKVVYVAGWKRVSVEGEETHPEHGERTSGFARRFLNGLGADGWELSGIQITAPGQAYYTFKRPLADGSEPDVSVARNGIVREQPESSGTGPQAVAL